MLRDHLAKEFVELSKSMKPKTTLCFAAIWLATLSTAFAGPHFDAAAPVPMETEPPSNSGDWAFRVEPFIWLPSLKGTVGALGRTSDIDLSLGDMFSGSGTGGTIYDIETYFAVEAEARKGRWGVIANFIYLDLDISGTPLTQRHLASDLDYTQFLGDLVGTYRVQDSARGVMDLYAGARVNSLSLDIRTQTNFINFPNEPAVEVSDTEIWIDPIVGLGGQWVLTDKVFLTGKADIGGFGVNSDFLWSAQASVGYQFTEHFSAEIGYRYYDTDYQDAGFTYDMALGGVFLGCSFGF